MVNMKVITRGGKEEDVRFDLITDKIKYLSSRANQKIIYYRSIQKFS